MNTVPPSSGDSSKSIDVVSDKFPVGLRVLVVDDDPTCLKILEKMLKTCRYEVTKCNEAEVALNLLRENKDGFDIVMSDVHMPDMDGFALLERVGLEMDLPVIMMSADDSLSVVMNGVKHGACDYLIKPVRMEALKTIWQHVVRKKGFKNIGNDNLARSCSVGDDEQPLNQIEDDNDSSSGNEEDLRNATRKRRGDEDGDQEENGNTSNVKKPRVVWSIELHTKFVKAVNELGIDKAVPKKILEKMNVPGLIRENVASHLQKYRIYLRKLTSQRRHSNLSDSSFMLQAGSSYGSKFLASAAHMPFRTFSSIRSSSTLGPGNINPSNSFQVDQHNIRMLEELRTSSLSPSSHTFGANVNMNHYVPSPSSSSRSSSSLPSQNNLAMPQIYQTRSQILNQVGHNRVLGRHGSNSNSSSSRPSMASTEASRAHFQGYSPGTNNFTPLASNYGLGSNDSRGMVLQEPNQFQAEMNTNMNNDFVSNYDGFSEPKNHCLHQNLAPPRSETSRHGNAAVVSQQLTSLSLVDDVSGTKGDAMAPDHMGFDNNYFGHDDDFLMSGLLSEVEAPGSVENYLGYDGIGFDKS